MGKAVKDRACPNAQCRMRSRAAKGNIRRYGFLRLKRGRRRRYRCKSCGGSSVSSVGTPYHRLKCTTAQSDKVAALSVEGLSKSAIARVMRTLAMQAGLADRRLHLPRRVHGGSRALRFRGCAAEGKMPASGAHSVLGAGRVTVTDGSTPSP